MIAVTATIAVSSLPSRRSGSLRSARSSQERRSAYGLDLRTSAGAIAWSTGIVVVAATIGAVF